MKFSIVLLVTILCISFCIEYVTSDRDGILQAFPEEDLTEGVAKTDAKDAEKIHRTLEESSKKVMTVKLSQDLKESEIFWTRYRHSKPVTMHLRTFAG